MNVKIFFPLIFFPLIFFLVVGCNSSKDNNPVHKNPEYSIENRVDDLMSRMTIKEKVAQLQCMVFQDVLKSNQIDSNGIGGMAYVRIHLPYSIEEEITVRNDIQRYVIENTRLGIPVLFHCEAIHGLVDKGSTSFPQAIGIAASWNPDLMDSISNAIAVEVKSRGFRQVLSPTVDIARDVRWGRVGETYGEDPYLSSKMAVAFCQGFESQNVITTLKHFVANSGPGGRDSHPVHHSERILREIYFQPYMHAVQKAGARSIMASYTAVDGTPSGVNSWLLNDILRDEWGFDGTVVTDYALLGKLYKSHKVAENGLEAAAKALKSGLDRDLPRIGENNTFYELPQALEKGLISMDHLDKATRRVLKQKFELGLFENPYSDPAYCAKITNNQKHKQLALDAARQSMVLLKNKDNVLPLSRDMDILVLGEDARKEKLGDYNPWDIEVVTFLEGLEKAVKGKGTVRFMETNNMGDIFLPPLSDEHFYSLKDNKKENGFQVSYYNNTKLEGTPVIDTTVLITEFDWGHKGVDKNHIGPREPFSARVRGSFISPWDKHVPLSLKIAGGARLIINNEVLFDNYDDPYTTNQKLTYTFKKGEKYTVVIEYNSPGQYSICNLTWDIRGENNETVVQAARAAKSADAVVIVAGVIEREGMDRASLDLTKTTEQLIIETAKTGTPVIVILSVGSAVTMNTWITSASAILNAWYPGQEGGTAVAEVVFGDYNPGGKLPVTFPQSVAQCPLYYNYKPSGRGYGYVDMTGDPLYEFGYGLSYTNFEYSDLKLSKNELFADEPLTITFKIKNTGTMKGDEVAQLYIHDKYASVVRPVIELKGFKRVSLNPNEEQEVSIVLTPEDFAIYNENMEFVVEPGEFDILIGSSSKDIRLRNLLIVKE